MLNRLSLTPFRNWRMIVEFSFCAHRLLYVPALASSYRTRVVTVVARYRYRTGVVWQADHQRLRGTRNPLRPLYYTFVCYNIQIIEASGTMLPARPLSPQVELDFRWDGFCSRERKKCKLTGTLPVSTGTFVKQLLIIP